MPRIPKTNVHSRLRGFHVRGGEISDALSEETIAYSTEIWLGDEAVGDARNDGRGGCDMIHVAPAHRDAWQALVVEAGRALAIVEEDGSRKPMLEPDGSLVGLLREMAILEATIARSKKFNSAVFAHKWEPMYGPDLWPELYVLKSGASEVTESAIESMDPSLRSVLVLGRDQDGFLRPGPK